MGVLMLQELFVFFAIQDFTPQEMENANVVLEELLHQAQVLIVAMNVIAVTNPIAELVIARCALQVHSLHQEDYAKIVQEIKFLTVELAIAKAAVSVIKQTNHKTFALCVQQELSLQMMVNVKSVLQELFQLQEQQTVLFVLQAILQMLVLGPLVAVSALLE